MKVWANNADLAAIAALDTPYAKKEALVQLQLEAGGGHLRPGGRRQRTAHGADGPPAPLPTERLSPGVNWYPHVCRLAQIQARSSRTNLQQTQLRPQAFEL